MRILRLLAAVTAVGLLAIGCGWSPPGPSPTSTQACGPADAPSPDTVTQAIGTLPQGAQWRGTPRGPTPHRRPKRGGGPPRGAPCSPIQVVLFCPHKPPP